MPSKELTIGYSFIRNYYKFVEKKYKKDEVDCPEPEESDYDDYDYGYGDEEVCDNDPDLDIRTGYRVYAKNGLELNSEYSALLDTYFRAGEYIHYFCTSIFI